MNSDPSALAPMPSSPPNSGKNFRPLVSIVIDNFNYARFLPAAIDSALGQSYTPTEVIVVDDGSTDNSAQVIARYGDRLVGVLKPNGGHASAFNAGFRASRGNIVFFLDADDMLLPNAVAEIVESWRPATAKAQFVLAHVDAEGQPLGGAVPYDSEEMPNGDLRNLILARGGYVTPPTSGNAFARSVLDRLLPLAEAQWRQAADTSLEILAPFLGDVVSIKKTLGLYRVHGANHGALREGLEGLDGRKLRVKLIIDVQREQALREFGRNAGFVVPRNWAAREPGHLKYRLASLRLDPAHHPFLDDNRFSLMLQGLVSSWKSPRYSIRAKLFHSAWFPLVALLPRSSAISLLPFALVPRARHAGQPAGEQRCGSRDPV